MTRTRLVAVALVLGLGAIGGCGSSSHHDVSSLTPTALLAKAAAAVKAEKYITISGKIDQGGKETGLDLHYVGEDSTGTITLNGATLDLESVGGKQWFKPSDTFWKKFAGAQAQSYISLINGRWIVLDPTNSDFAELAQIATRDFVNKNMLKPEHTVTKGPDATVNGVKCVTLKDANGTLYLDASTARPVQIVGSDSKDNGTATFSYQAVPAPKAPGASEQVDLSKLGG